MALDLCMVTKKLALPPRMSYDHISSVPVPLSLLIQGVTEGMDQTSGECSLGHTITI